MPRDDPREMARVEAFSDGVFAIAITLLALDLKVPELPAQAGAAALAGALAREWPSYVAFLISFVSVLVMWVNHHGLFTRVRRPDPWFLFANGALLMLVTVVPFSTRLLATWLPRPGAAAACAEYGAHYFFINVAYNLLWLSVASRRRLLKPDVDADEAREIGRRLRLGVPVYFGATLAAFVQPWLSVALCASLWLFWARMPYRILPAA